jgi:ketosteroid isomerase-like protein
VAPRDNAELARLAYDAWNRGDREAVFGVLDPDIEFWQAAELPGSAGLYRGHAGVAQALDDLESAFEDFRLEPQEIRSEGDRLAIDVRITGRGRGSGAPFEVVATHAVWVRDGEAVRWEAHFDRADALRSLGLD